GHYRSDIYQRASIEKGNFQITLKSAAFHPVHSDHRARAFTANPGTATSLPKKMRRMRFICRHIEKNIPAASLLQIAFPFGENEDRLKPGCYLFPFSRTFQLYTFNNSTLFSCIHHQSF